jgi:predicted RNA-binding protein with TRAM domain
MEIPTKLLTLFSGEVDHRDGSFVIEIPESEVDLGNVQADSTYRVAILPGPDESDTDDDTEAGRVDSPDRSDPPVEEGERRTVEIESLGDQGDGVTRVERGFVVIVSDTNPGERVTVEITNVRENVAFADVVDRPAGFQ